MRHVPRITSDAVYGVRSIEQSEVVVCFTADSVHTTHHISAVLYCSCLEEIEVSDANNGRDMSENVGTGPGIQRNRWY